MSLTEITEDKIYFFNRNNNVTTKYKLDISTEELEELPSLDRQEFKQVEHYLLSTINDQTVFISNQNSGEDEVTLEIENGIRQLDYSYQDSTFVILDHGGTIWKIDANLNVNQLPCSIPSMVHLRRIKVEGSRLITIHDMTFGETVLNSVSVTDLNTCNIDFQFTTDHLQNYNSEISFVKSESNDTEYTIIKFSGAPQLHGAPPALHYFMDHNSNNIELIQYKAGITNNTAFIHNNSAYFIAYQYSDNVNVQEYLIRYDFEQQEIIDVTPPFEDLFYITLGYATENKLLAATNTFNEDPKVWTINQNDEYDALQDLSFSTNYGVGYPQNIIPSGDRLYFTTYNGLHSVLDTSRHEIIVERNGSLIRINSVPEIFYFEDKFCQAIKDDDKTIFNTLSTETDIIETIIDNSAKDIYRAKQLGPLITYSQGNSDDTLHIFDMRSNEINIYPEIPYTGYLSAEGAESAIF